MCGICGFTEACEDDLNTLTKMCDTMAHRGPDGSGQYISDRIALGHRRLSLVDLEHGNQPIIKESLEKDSVTWHGNRDTFNKRGDYAIVLNGEIYNYKEIKKELESLGYQFTTKSDTEVVLVGYIKWGKEVLNKIRGMFAFAIWDANIKELFCARDFFGIKPFYYTFQNNQFIFASEIKSILEHNNCSKEININALEQYLCFQFSALHETFFKGIFSLPQGHYIVIDKNGHSQIKQYWRPKFYVDKKGNSTKESKYYKYYKNHEELTKLINDKMSESVEYHNIADVEVGSLLSSGIDSSYNAALLQKINPSIKTFTVGFEDFINENPNEKNEKNEIAWAKELAELINVDNYSKTISEEEFWDSLPKIIWHMDEPLGDPSAIALYFVDQLASKHVKAVLSGEGADELFGGYTIYQTNVTANRISWIPKPILKCADKILKSMNVRGSHYLERAINPVEDWYYTNAYENAFNAEERKKVLKNPNKNIPFPKDITKNVYCQANNDAIDNCAKMQYADLNFWIIGDIFLKGDKMSMAHSLECRVPFLDKEVFEVARAIPTHEKITNSQTKIALRDAALNAIPESWASKKKLGFPVPMAQWIREEKYYNIIKSYFKNEVAQKYFNTEYLLQILEEHKNTDIDNSRKIWIIYMFLLWHEVFFND